MVAACYLFNKSLALLAFLNIRSVLPSLYFFLKGTIATRTGMCLSTALVAYLRRALRALACFFIRIGAHNNRTFGVGTPLQQRTFLYLEIPEE